MRHALENQNFNASYQLVIQVLINLLINFKSML